MTKKISCLTILTMLITYAQALQFSHETDFNWKIANNDVPNIEVVIPDNFAGIGTILSSARVQHASVQAENSPRNRVNWLSGEILALGLGFRYSWDINRFFSIGATTFLSFFDNVHEEYEHSNDLWLITGGVIGTARFFPWNSVFYLEMGFGWGLMRLHNTRQGSRSVNYSGAMITPAIGLRLDGQRRAFFVNPFISMPILLNNRDVHDGSILLGIGLGRAW